MTTFKDAVRQVFPHAQFSDEPGVLPADLKASKDIALNYTAIVDALRGSPNPRLAMLGRALWDIVHHRHVRTALYEGVTVVTFAVVAPQGGFLLIPPQ